MGEAPEQRLDSWKAIAEYLKRDVATVRRWEKSSGLPVRRLPGVGRGRSVFAYVSEIDAWLKATPPSEPPPDAPANGQPLDEDPALRPAPVRARWIRWSIAAVATALLIVTGLLWRERSSRGEAVPATVQVTPEAVIARDGSGVEQWRYPFAAGERGVLMDKQPERVVDAAHLRGILAATSSRVRAEDEAALSGRLMWFTPDGVLAHSASIDDRVEFTQAAYQPPWVITDYRLDARGEAPRIALAVHHQSWWPSIVTVLDEQWRRRGTFVNAGWVEWVRWMSPDRLLIAGFSNPRDGGMVALLDAGALDGQSPADAGSEFRCVSCGPQMPIRYVIMPRSEINRVTASPFNRAFLEMAGDRLLVHTIEMPLSARAVDALYEFSPSLDLISASFSDRYWEIHAALEKEGKISHGRAACPDRDGPREIQVWEPGTGWKTQPIRH